MADQQFGDDDPNTLYGSDNVIDIISGLGGDDDIYGKSGNDILYGDDGFDFLFGEDGHDTLYGGADDDGLGGGTGNDTLVGGLGDDALSGEDGEDTLDGGPGDDDMSGGDGDDTYYVDSDGDEVSEGENDGIDTVIASISYTLPGPGQGRFENLTLAGTVSLNGTGNSLANIITGNGGNNTLIGGGGWDTLAGGGGVDTLDGGTGSDTLRGGPGNDTLTGGPGQDNFVFDTRHQKFDTITDFFVSDDTIWLDGAVFAGTGPRGPLNSNFFAIGSAARDADDRIIYDPTTGFLGYDPDGKGPQGAAVFAMLDPGLALTSSDFWVF